MPTSKTEQVARDLFKHYLPMLMVEYGIRPDWLRWPVTGNRLELDIYFPQIKVAVEIQGIQHGRPIVGLQRDFAAFERQQARDLWKMEECHRLGIALHHLTIFDLTAQRFPTKLRLIIDTALANPSLAPAIRDQLQRTRLRLSTMPIPHDLFAQAERLSWAKFRPPKPKKVSWWRRLFRRG